MNMINMDNQFLEQMAELRKEIETHKNERDEMITKFQESEKIWKAKVDKITVENETHISMITSMKDDNRDILIEYDKALKRSKQLENNLEREKTKLNDAEDENKDLRKEKDKLENLLFSKTREHEEDKKKVVEM